MLAHSRGVWCRAERRQTPTEFAAQRLHPLADLDFTELRGAHEVIARLGKLFSSDPHIHRLHGDQRALVAMDATFDVRVRPRTRDVVRQTLTAEAKSFDLYEGRERER